MNLLPALQVLRTDDGVVVKQHLADDDVRGVHDAHVQRRQALHVLVVRARPEFEQSSGRKFLKF